MLETEREAKRLMHDPSSWSQGGIKTRAYRAMQLTPEEEAPRHRRSRRSRARHVHKWGPWSLLRTEWRYGWTAGASGAYRRKKSPDAVYVLERACKRCGHKDWARSPSKGGPVGREGRYRYWL